MIKRAVTYPKTLRNILAVFILRVCGLLTRPFGFKRFGWAGVFVGRYVGPNTVCTARLNDDSLFRFYLADYYWSKLVYKGFYYEPEIARSLLAISSLDYLFLDLGANHGYWSVLVSSVQFGKKSVIAVEPVKFNFQCLSHNNRLNNYRFAAIRGAVCETEGRQVQINVNPNSMANEAASILVKPEYALSGSESVESVSIDQLVKQFSAPGQMIVVKLDVEGMEIDAIKGAASALKREFLLIYEEHGSDPDHTVSRFVIEQGFFVFHLENGRYSPIIDIDDVNLIKVQPNKGYNLFACNKDSSIAKTIERSFSH